MVAEQHPVEAAQHGEFQAAQRPLHRRVAGRRGGDRAGAARVRRHEIGPRSRYSGKPERGLVPQPPVFGPTGPVG